MDKKRLIAPALVAGLLLAGCSAEPPTEGVAPAAPDAAAPAPDAAAAAVAVAAGAAVAYAMPADAPVAGHCALDAVNGVHAPSVSVPVGSTAMFGGWAATADKQVPTDALLVLANGTDSHAVPLVAGADRPDVAAALGSDALQQAGYNLQVDLGAVPAGRYGLVVVIDKANPALCDLGTTLVIE